MTPLQFRMTPNSQWLDTSYFISGELDNRMDWLVNKKLSRKVRKAVQTDYLFELCNPEANVLCGVFENPKDIKLNQETYGPWRQGTVLM